jgi:hypothetical protein
MYLEIFNESLYNKKEWYSDLGRGKDSSNRAVAIAETKVIILV